MNLLRIALALVLLGGGVRWWMQRSEHRAVLASADPYGFLSVPMPSGAKPDTVLIFAPLNCPREGARRANELSR
ncbi:MAG TPA: hypothetical protein VHE37_01355, partial [Nevskiaceae bacterium]|nr:hypothetical protein [Nevskiaceae bacterium]